MTRSITNGEWDVQNLRQIVSEEMILYTTRCVTPRLSEEGINLGGWKVQVGNSQSNQHLICCDVEGRRRNRGRICRTNRSF